MNRPKFADLTETERLDFGNGVGPHWFPDRFRSVITSTCSWFFMDASWRHHDFGYAIGGDEFDRIRCDWKFLVAMMRDSVSQPRRTWLVAAPLAMMLSLFFFLAVLLMGWNGSFRYSDRYATIEEIRDWSRI